MADKAKKKTRGNYCVAGGPNLTNCENNSLTPGVSMHYFPKDETLRKKWTLFVRVHRKYFVPSKSATLCSVHFDEKCFESKHVPFTSAETGKAIQPKRYLIKGSVPTRYAVVPHSSPITSRKRRRIMRDLQAEEQSSKRQKTSCTSISSPYNSNASSEASVSVPHALSFPTTSMCSSSVTTTLTTTEGNVMQPIAGSSQTDDYSFQDTLSAPVCTSTPRPKCTRCVKHRKKVKALTKQHNRLKKRFIKLQQKFKLLQACEDSKEESDMEEQAFPRLEEGEQEEQAESSSNQEWEEDDEEDTDYAQLEDSAPSAEEYSSQSDDDSKGNDSSSNIRVVPGTPSYKEPKFIVFFSMLLSLFTMVCFKCKKSEPRATMKQRGTMVVVSQHCTTCGDNAFSWRSQPLIFGKYPAGNMLLSFGVLMAGASISKVLLVMRHMGLCAYSARTFFVHQKNFLFPVILNYWEQYRTPLIGKLKNMANVVWSGDGQFDSMGHSAKYGAYTMFCNTILKVVHFELLQANETGGSSPMELEGAKRSFSYLKSVGLSISIFISDRHRGLAKWMRECQPDCAHFFDIWHIARSIGKAMIKLSKEKGCEKIGDWVKGVRNHLYWCVTSTKQGFQELIAAKWQSFMQHVANKHDGHPTPIFKKCAHEEIGS